MLLADDKGADADRRRRHPRDARRVPRQGPRRHGQHVPHPAAGRRQAGRRQGRQPALPRAHLQPAASCSCCVVGLLRPRRRPVVDRRAARRSCRCSAPASDDLWSSIQGVFALIDFRYHLVSIVSIFLALAVGIVLGAGPLKERARQHPEQGGRRAAPGQGRPATASSRRPGPAPRRATPTSPTPTRSCSPGRCRTAASRSSCCPARTPRWPRRPPPPCARPGRPSVSTTSVSEDWVDLRRGHRGHARRGW